MKIAIVGAGAMGCLYGGKLSAVDTNEVYLLDVWADHVNAIQQKGLLMDEGEETLVYNRVKALTDSSEVGPVDLAIVFVKSTLTETAVKSNASVFGPNTIALTLQNGLGNIDIIAEAVGKENVLAGTTAHGANMVEPGHMRHAGSGATVIGELDGSDSDRLEAVCQVMAEAGMLPEKSFNVMGLVWDKLLVNVGINALTGITNMQNGKLLDYEETNSLLEDAVKEGVAVAEALGIQLINDEPVAHAREVAKATGENVSSMLADVRNGKKTEIDMINGAIVREGAKLGMACPVNDVLSRFIGFLEKRNLEK